MNFVERLLLAWCAGGRLFGIRHLFLREPSPAQSFVQPYVGLLFSSVSGDLKRSGDFEYSIEEDQTFGFFTGLEYRLIPHLDLGFEFRGGSVGAVSFFMNYYINQ